MCADRLGKRRKPLVFQNRFDFLTLHGTSLRDEQPLGSSSHKLFIRATPRTWFVAAPRIESIVTQSELPPSALALWRSCLARSRASSCSSSRRRVRALCNCDFELPTEQPMMSAISLCS